MPKLREVYRDIKSKGFMIPDDINANVALFNKGFFSWMDWLEFRSAKF